MASASTSSSATTTTRAPKLTCLCSPTNHPGSFRCSRHRNNPRGRQAPSAQASGEAGHQQHHRELRGGRSAATAKGRSVRALLLQKISCPSGHDRQRRHRGDFQPRPSRLRLMNK